jgi:tRNA dimethylallyltransferase
MESKSNQPPLICIVGETASGKTALAIELARRFNGEIIAADSRTVYKEMDIGTAKPTAEERGAVPHHLLNVVSPGDHFTVADFKTLANREIQHITSRAKVPFLVGGSGLYVDAVIYDFKFRGPADEATRRRLQQLSVEELQQQLATSGIPLPENSRNPRHLIRTLETGGQKIEQSAMRPNTLVLGMTIDQEELREKVTKRVDLMAEEGFIEEVRTIAERYGWDAPALQAPGYKAFRKYLANEITLEEAKLLFVRNDLQLAKRQRTWFRRNKGIHYIRNKEEAVALTTTFLNKVPTAN